MVWDITPPPGSLKTPLFTPLRQSICDDACGLSDIKTPVITVILQFNSRSPLRPAELWGNQVLCLVPLLQGTEVIDITFRSLSADSLGTTHIV